MRFRKLRVAWSAGCGLLAVVLIVVWIRSYFWTDQLTRQDSSAKFMAITLGDGRLLLGESNDPDLGIFLGPGWSSRSCEWAKSGSIPFFPASVPQEHRGHIFGWPEFSADAFVPSTTGPRYSQFILPFWLLVLPMIALTIAPWLRWRFTLRTLLIATTLVAVVLGLIVCLAR